MSELISRFVRCETGLELTEYAVACALIVVSIAVALGLLSSAIVTAIENFTAIIAG